MKNFILALMLCLGLANIATARPPIFNDNYEQAVQTEGKVLVVFGTDWCRYCKVLKNDMDSLNLDDYTICVINADKRKDLSRKYRVRSYPTSVILEGEKEVTRKSGYEKNEYQSWLDASK